MVNFQNVTFKYKGCQKPSIENINLNIKSGQCIVLCGRSGCGKTTITRILNGLITEFYKGELSGKVMIENTMLPELPIYKISEKVGSVFQNPRTQFFNSDTDSEIAFGVENLAIPNEKIGGIVDKSFQDLNIEYLKNRNLFELSGGEKQKIAFASIYAMNPNIYVLDEPSSNLDSRAINDLKSILKFLKSKGKTILIAEHRLYYLKGLVDTIYYINEGTIEEKYSVDEFLKISEEEREKKGLRTMDLNRVKFNKQSIDFGEQILSIKNVTLYYGKKEIIKSFNLTVNKGECIGIIGHNGAGKSTFLRTLCGLHNEYNGEILVQKKKLTDKERLKKSYLVMQDVNYQLFAETVQDESSFGLKDFKEQDVLDTLKALDLYEYKDNHPNTLSGGQKQRLAVSTSIISNRDILIFDEPTSGLDFDSMVRVSKLMENLINKGKIIFLVTHDYEFICKTCTRILHFHQGELKDDYSLYENEGKTKLKDFFVL